MIEYLPPVQAVPSDQVEESVEAVFTELLSNNLFVSIEEVEATPTTLNVVLALYGPKGLHDRVLAHEGLIRGPVGAFKKRLVTAFPTRAVELQFFQVDITSASYRTYLKNAGYTEADL